MYQYITVLFSLQCCYFFLQGVEDVAPKSNEAESTSRKKLKIGNPKAHEAAVTKQKEDDSKDKEKDIAANTKGNTTVDADDNEDDYEDLMFDEPYADEYYDEFD